MKCAAARKEYGVMDNWFTIDEVDTNTYIISEYRHWEETQTEWKYPKPAY